MITFQPGQRLQFPVHDPRNDKKITVYPTNRNVAKVIRHPIDGPVNQGGSLWTEDGLTARLLMEGSLTTDPARGWKDESALYDPTVPPSHATAVPDNPPTMTITTRKNNS